MIPPGPRGGALRALISSLVPLTTSLGEFLDDLVADLDLEPLRA
jgi:hypothetical protein